MVVCVIEMLNSVAGAVDIVAVAVAVVVVEEESLKVLVYRLV